MRKKKFGASKTLIYFLPYKRVKKTRFFCYNINGCDYMQVIVGISKRHIHLTEDTYIKLFGDNNISIRNKLNQKGEFASNSVLTIKNEDKEIDNVRVVGPFREYNQIEIARSDAEVLGVNPPVRNSGDLEESSSITVIGPLGEVVLENALIIAQRHLHISPEEAKVLGLENNQKISFPIYNEKGESLEVYVKHTKNGVAEIHIDNDEALVYNLKTGDMIDYEF